MLFDELPAGMSVQMRIWDTYISITVVAVNIFIFNIYFNTY